MKGLNWDTIAKTMARATILFMVACGLVMTIFQVHPFFLDEWAIIYNLKFKTATELWGGLDKTQQFPRVYLQVLKWFTSLFDYSYTSLRLPSFLVHCFGLWYCIYLSKKLFRDNIFYQWLWVLIYAAYPTSIFYFVLTKQYTMEMLMGLVGIVQLWQLVNINKGEAVSPARYAWLCASFFIAPLFSYTYPMVAAPIFGVVLLNTFSKGSNLGRQWLALLLCAIGILLLYRLDITQVMQDKGMENYWKDYYMTNGFSITELLHNIYMYFYLFGRGPFMILLGVVGMVAWLFGTYKSVGILRKKDKAILEWLVLYSVSLMWLSIVLFIMGKLPLNAHRLNAYKTAATGIIIIYFFMQLQQSTLLRKPVYAVAGVLFVLQIVFIVQPLIRDFTEETHKRKMLIYNNGKTAVAIAQEEKIPVFTTSMTLYPHDDIDQADWVIKSYPLYNKEMNIPVYPISDSANIDSLMHVYQVNAVVVTTGDSVYVIKE